MKNIILLILLIFCIEDVFSNDAILSKFVQNTFKIKDVRTEAIRFNKSVYHFFELKTFKYNRTTTAHNCTFRPKINVEDKTEAVVQVYKFYSNEYRHFPIRFQVNLKKAFESNAMGIKNLIKCGNLTSFTFYKDIIYHICNFVVDDTRFPPLIPSGMYKVEIVLLYLNKEAGVANLYGEVYTPMAYPKK